MLNYPFDPEIWNGNLLTKEYTLFGIDIYKPTFSEHLEKQYATYSKNYWEGVRRRQYEYRMNRKIERETICSIHYSS